MEKFNFLSKEKISYLPKESGVYVLFKGRGGEILYIGKAANLRERIKNHFHSVKYREAVSNPSHKGWVFNRVKRIGYIKINSEIEALILEANLIKKYQPKYNVVWKDDKNYFYVGITKETCPRIFITHQPKAAPQKSKTQNSKLKTITKNLKLKTTFIGPFVNGVALKQTLRILRKVFPYRTCKTLPKRPCLWHQLGRCPAPCLLKISVYRKQPSVSFDGRTKKECQRNAKNLMKILREGKSPALKELKKEMKLASKNQDFETAGKIRDQISVLERIVEHAKIFESPEGAVLIQPWQINTTWKKTEKELKKALKTKGRISRIEAYDVSNIQGKEATGSMVTFINGLPDKNFYRKFKIKIARKPNDIAMIKEILSRRFKHLEWPFPDLILVDGGSAQFNIALRLKMKNEKLKMVPTIALAKRENKLYVENRKKPILLKNLPREIFNLILQLRDEAHRFARKYHLKLREIDFFPKS